VGRGKLSYQFVVLFIDSNQNRHPTLQRYFSVAWFSSENIVVMKQSLRLMEKYLEVIYFLKIYILNLGNFG